MTDSFGLSRRGVLAAAGGALVAGDAWAQNRPLTLETTVTGEPLVLRSERRFAGAITSLRFRGVEHVDAADHGRLFQTAVQFGGLGECLNPTQAGASRDRSRSTSRLLSATVAADVWETTTQAAFWHRPSDRCTTLEGVRRRPANRTRLSEALIGVRHRFGSPVHPHAVETEVTITLSEAEPQVVVEALTLYAPAAFDTFHAVAPRRLIPDYEAVARPGERPEPRIVSTSDGAHAVSLFSRDGAAGHGRWRFPTVGKLNLVFRPGRLEAGSHVWRCGWAVGTREEVAAAVRAAT